MTFIHTESPAEAYECEAFAEALAESDDPADRAIAGLMDEVPDEGEPQWTFADQRAAFSRLSDRVGEWHGFPIPLPDLKLTLHDRHPLKRFYATYDTVADVQQHRGEAFEHVCRNEDVDDTTCYRNTWWSHRLQAQIVIVQDRKGIRAMKHLKWNEMRRFKLQVNTMLATDAWDLEAESKALDKLDGMVSGRAMRAYLLTGAFTETSKRSGIIYLFRRLRPTIALSPHWGDVLWPLAALCLHPIGYYQDSFAGCMVPTDDVIAHLTLMRGDEADFWGKANQHQLHEPEAGL